MTLPIAILAGGLGTRLWPLTRLKPKSLVDVNGKAFIFHQLELLARNGITDVVLCVGYLGGDILTAVSGIGYDYGLNIAYSHDGSVPLGTGGALRKALPMLGDAFFVMYGDTYLDCNFSAIEQTFRQLGKRALMTLFHHDSYVRPGNVAYEEGEIRLYSRRASRLSYTDYGLIALRADAIRHFPPGENFDLSSVWWWLIASRELRGYLIDRRPYEIGSPDGLEEFRRYISERSRKVAE